MSKAKESPVHIRELNPATGKKERKQVDTAKYLEYDSVAEAIELEGEPKILELINVQTKTNELNRLRAVHRPGGIGKTAIRNKAMELLTEEDWMTIARSGGEHAETLQRLVDSRLEEAEAQLRAKAGIEDDDGDDD